MESGPAVKGVLGNWRLEREEEGFVAGSAGFAICLLLLLGACGKSAQFPLHVWLPDAMEGPTPVSALIHAATMVTAGVYLVARCAPLFYVSPEAQLAVACIGAQTALLAGLIALTQTDLKRVLAYSTVSQLGYMFLALGTGSHLGVIAGMFHLFTHAFFKALLFLGSGSVMHAMGNVIDMTRFGGLRKILPITCITFAVGCLALSGIPPLAGFFSKDMILAAVHEKAHAHGTYFEIYEWLYYGAMFTAFLTAFYTFRAFFLTFFGEEHVPEEAHGHAHESPRVMWVPLAVLAVCAATVGFLEPLHVFGPLLDQTPQLAYAPIQATAHHGADHTEIAMVSVIVALVGIGIAAFLYCGDRREVGWLSSLLKFEWLGRAASSNWAGAFSRLSVVRTIDRAAAVVGLLWLVRAVGWLLLAVASILMLPLLLLYWVSPYRLSKGKFYFDEIYNALIVRPLSAVAQTFYWIDQYLIDGLVNLCGRIPPAVGRLLRSLQMGLVQFYALAMVLGLLVLLAARMVFAG